MKSLTGSIWDDVDLQAYRDQQSDRMQSDRIMEEVSYPIEDAVHEDIWAQIWWSQDDREPISFFFL